MRLISESEVDRLIDPAEAIDLAAQAYILQSTGGQPSPGRIDLRKSTPKAGMLVLAGVGSGRLGIVKSNMHAYRGEPPTRHTASLLALWDMDACVPLALVSTAAFNGHRTASGFAAAARALARPDAATLAVFGSGHMAAPAIHYMAAVRPIERVLIASRRFEQAADFAARMQRNGSSTESRFEAEANPHRAAAEADIIVCVTSADQPVFPGNAVRPGTFVVLGGANRPTAREVDDALIRRARIYVDHLEGCLEKAGDIRIPIASGALRREDIAGEVGKLLAKGGLEAPADVTAFKSIGIAPQDLAMAEYVLRKAEAAGAGTRFDPQSGRIDGEAS